MSASPSRLSRSAARAATMLAAAVFTLCVAPALAHASASRSAYRAQRLCATVRPGYASCLGLRLVPASLTGTDLTVNAARQAGEVAAGAAPAVTYKSPFPGNLTPESLHAAYDLPTEPPSSLLQTVAVVDAYNDPTAESDLAVFDKQFGLPACTTANGCFRKVNQEGKTSPLPRTQGEWATEISLDVQMAHAICQSCRVLLVEASSEMFASLGDAVDAAVSAGATEISNSYGGPEASSYSSLNAPYDHPGLVVTVSSGDCGYLNQACPRTQAANFPADSPDVIAVGGTSLAASGEHWTSTVWDDGGSGCSQAFTAPLWQSEASDFAGLDCADGRSVADVAAVADPYTGVDIYDSTPAGNGDPTGWDVVGGTSASSPILAAEFGLAGGSHGAEYPAQTLYSNLGDGSALTDVVSGSNGSCSGNACRAVVGLDGPTGVGSPVGLLAFAAAGSPAATTAPTIAGPAEQGQVLTVTHGEWSGTPTSFTEQWALCNATGADCRAVPGATGASLAVTAADVGSTVRVLESASNAAGTGTPSAAAPTATVVSDTPKITTFTPASGATGSSVTITGRALNGASAVRFGSLSATFTVTSSTQIEATVPNGALAEAISVTTPVKTATSGTRFQPTFSLTSFTPKSGAPGTAITLTGMGFRSNSAVQFDGVPAASVTYVSATKLMATVPAGANGGAITVTNTVSPAGTVSGAGAFAVT